MTLQEWCDRHAIPKACIHNDIRGSIAVVVEYGHPGRDQLWGLTDYKVSSACGVVLWFRPKGGDA